MYTPMNDYPIMWGLPLDPMVKDTAEPMIVIENVTPDAVYDQVQAYYRAGLTYDGLMGIYGNTATETEREAIRWIITGKDWDIVAAYDNEYVASVQQVVARNGKITCETWARVDADTLEADALHAVGLWDNEFAAFLRDLAEQIHDAEAEHMAECSYYVRHPYKL